MAHNHCVEVDVQSRMKDVMYRLYPSVNAAARASNVNPGQLLKVLNKNIPGIKLLGRIAEGWGVPMFCFLMPPDMAEPYVVVAELRQQSLQNSDSIRGGESHKRNTGARQKSLK